jgi:hypothetical protein
MDKVLADPNVNRQRTNFLILAVSVGDIHDIMSHTTYVITRISLCVVTYKVIND